MTTSTNTNTHVLGQIADALVFAPAQAIGTYGNQALVTFASSFMTAQFAGSHNILPSPVNWILAAGFEWTYLKGLSDSGKVKTRWTTALNYGAFASVGIWGVLYVLIQYKVIPEQPDQAAAIALALAHILPIAFVTLCSAMVHKAVATKDGARVEVQQQLADERQQRLSLQRDELAIEDERRRAELTIEDERRRAELAFKEDEARRKYNLKRELVQLQPQHSALNQDGTVAVQPVAQPAPATKQRGKPVVIDGTEYKNQSAAARALGITHQAVSKRVAGRK